MYKAGINIRVQVVIITCCLTNLVYSVPLYAFSTSEPPRKLVQTGIEESAQVLKNWFPYDDSVQNWNYFYSVPSVVYEKIKPQPTSDINKLTRGNKKYSDRIQVNEEYEDSSRSEIPGSFNSETNEGSSSQQDFDSNIVSWSATGTDYSDATSEYETTTNSLENRLGGGAGGASPAVLASLLG
ncbi:uncharacterized protein LOC125226644 [Leguminivora glycinivorella]|uniref:uncharacterized protein LOC125226644 n=1 Tax=Leguminivora glycinivorella TaxID=1035111 RepID=UPI002010B050|nr:uncharacterized protein LOC125226644 [Leguminivora glycinivorella]